jgi:DegV family protein with EDD domain
VELTKQEFYDKLRTAQEIPTTATPPPTAYEEVFRQLAKDADAIVSIHLAANLSGLHSAAAVAATNVPGIEIAVIDSEQVTMGYGWMAVAAAEAARQGEGIEQIAALVENMRDRSRVLAVLDTLDYVYRGGRVGWVAAMIGTLMQIKPIIEVRKGEVKLIERARTLKRSLNRLMSLIQALGPLERAIVLHANAPDLATQVADRLQAAIPTWERLIAPAGVTIASHAGPGAVGIACVTAE